MKEIKQHRVQTHAFAHHARDCSEVDFDHHYCREGKI
jgi:hypothetical protein